MNKTYVNWKQKPIFYFKTMWASSGSPQRVRGPSWAAPGHSWVPSWPPCGANFAQSWHPKSTKKTIPVKKSSAFWRRMSFEFLRFGKPSSKQLNTLKTLTLKSRKTKQKTINIDFEYWLPASRGVVHKTKNFPNNKRCRFLLPSIVLHCASGENFIRRSMKYYALQ